MKEYIIKKILSNNVLLVERKEKKYILVGKGIGFGKKKETVLKNTNNVEEKFLSLEGLNENEYESFIKTVDPRIIEISEKIIKMVSNKLGENQNPRFHAGLLDHINFAIKRLKEGIEIINPFLNETKLLYPKEFELAEKAVKILKEEMKMDIPRDEIGFLALHFYGSRENNTKEEALIYTRMINEISSFVEKELDIDLNNYSFEYTRLIMHLRGAINRISKNKSIENKLLDQLKNELKHEFKLANHIAKIIEKELKINVPESEIGYIALHLHKLNNKID